MIREIKNNKVWLGTGLGRWISGFIVPDFYELYGTEARLSEMGQFMLEDINERIVPYKDNFDATEKDSCVLPSKFPQLLVNGCDGLAVGMRTYIPTHNLGELIELTNKLYKEL